MVSFDFFFLLFFCDCVFGFHESIPPVDRDSFLSVCAHEMVHDVMGETHGGKKKEKGERLHLFWLLGRLLAVLSSSLFLIFSNSYSLHILS